MTNKLVANAFKHSYNLCYPTPEFVAPLH